MSVDEPMTDEEAVAFRNETFAWPDRFVVIDTETTGLDPTSCRLLEVAVVRVKKGKITAKYSWLVNPGSPIPPEVSAVHGITDAMVKDAPTFAEIAIEIASRCDGAPLAAYNEGFDRGFIREEWKRAELSPAPWLGSPWICGLVWAREAQKYEKGKKLGQVAARLGIAQPDGAHRALADAITCTKILLALRRTGEWADWSRRQRREGKSDDVRSFFPSEWGACIRAQEALRAAQEQEFAAWRSRNPRAATGT